jgi:hypothetical protein
VQHRETAQRKRITDTIMISEQEQKALTDELKTRPEFGSASG